MEQIPIKNIRQDYKIIPLFSNNGTEIETVIEKAFIKYLKYNDYKYDNAK